MIRNRLSWFAICASAVLPAVLVGCGPEPRPRVVVETPLGIQSGDVTISFRVHHRSGDAVDLKVIFTADGGKNWRPATVVDADSATKGLSSSEKGVDHTLQWDSVSDGVGLTCSADEARIHILPVTSADEGRPGRTDDFRVNNTFGAAPRVTVDPITGIQSGEVQIFYTISDEEGDPASIQAEYSTDGGGSYRAARTAPSSDPTTNIFTSPLGEFYTFVWDSTADIGFDFLTEVRVRITASDGIMPAVCERPSEANDFRVDNRYIVPRLYVTNPGSSDLQEVDTNTGAVTTFATAASSPYAIAVVRHAQDAYLMVTDNSANRVLVLDASDNSFVQEMPTQTAPKDIAVARVDDGSGTLLHKAYVANSVSDSVTVLDAEGFAPTLTTHIVLVGTEPTGVATATVLGTTTVYVTLAGDDAVAEIDGAFGILFGPIPLPPGGGRRPGPIATVEAASGTFIYVASTLSDSVAVLDAWTGSFISTPLWGVAFPDPSGIASLTMPSGRTLALVSCPGDGSIRAIDVDAGHTFFTSVRRAAIDPRGIVALRTHFGNRAYVADSATGELGQIDLDDLDANGSAFPLPPIPGLATGIFDIVPVP